MACAVAVLAGALLVGESVRASLRSLALGRIGNTQYAVTGESLFRETLAGVPVIALEALVIHQESGRRAGGVELLGVDRRFWEFHGWAGDPPGSRGVLVTEALARELGSGKGDGLLIRVRKLSAIPLESLHGRKDEEAGQTVRLTQEGNAREFSLQPRQGSVRAVFVDLQRLQREMGQEGRANVALAAERPRIRENVQLEDLGIRIRGNQVQTDSAIVSDAVYEAAQQTGAPLSPVFTYLANTIRTEIRQMPYSLVTGLASVESGIVLNEWAARDLQARPGDTVWLDYYVWLDEGRLGTRTAEFRVSSIVPTEDRRELAPVYPGISDSDDLTDWDPPFPMDLGRVRPLDEEYWDRYRTTPKAFIGIADAQRLWGSRHGRMTSIQFQGDAAEFARKLRNSIDPERMGLTVIDVREQNLAASQGVTDFGEYFVYFSFFLMVSALLLAGLFFKLGIEQRLREIGTLQALGFGAGKIRNLFLAEGAVLSGAGAVVGMIGAVAYAALVLFGLRTWWRDAVGTELLSLHVTPAPLVVGAAGGAVAALVTILWTLRRAAGITSRGLMAGSGMPPQRMAKLAAGSALCATLLLLAAAAGLIPQSAAFFTAGALLLISALLFGRWWLVRTGLPLSSRTRLAFRNAGYRPSRSMLCAALIASATFLIVAVDAFRKHGDIATPYPYVAESLLPIVSESPLDRIEAVRFRLRPGDDASCLNLYQPRNPRVLGAPEGFIRASGEQWMPLLNQPADDAVPAIADANSLAYSLHKKVGDILELGPGVRLRIAGAMRNSLFQSELVISENHFKRLFPEHEGYRFFLLKDAPSGIEEELSDYGFDVTPSQERLAAYHRVENTYLSTFQSLGALGLLLGTVGLAAVLLRNVLERRRELALLRAVGYTGRDLALLVFAENALLLLAGVAIGAVCALIAIAPAFLERGGRFSWSLPVLLAAVVLTGLTASLLATRAAVRAPLLESLRAE